MTAASRRAGAKRGGGSRTPGEEPRPSRSRRRAGSIAGALFFLIAGCIAGVYGSRTPPPEDRPSAAPAPATPVVSPVAGDRVRVELKSVVDGDTISVVLDGKTQKVRYLGIDTPESYASTASGIEYLGKEASQRNGALIAGRAITLQYDGPRLDRYGRVLAYVYADDVDVCKQLLTEGYAEVYRKAPNIQHYADYLAVEEVARKNGCGVWDAAAKAAWEAAHPAKSKR